MAATGHAARDRRLQRQPKQQPTGGSRVEAAQETCKAGLMSAQARLAAGQKQGLAPRRGAA